MCITSRLASYRHDTHSTHNTIQFITAVGIYARSFQREMFFWAFQCSAVLCYVPIVFQPLTHSDGVVAPLFNVGSYCFFVQINYMVYNFSEAVEAGRAGFFDLIAVNKTLMVFQWCRSMPNRSVSGQELLLWLQLWGPLIAESVLFFWGVLSVAAPVYAIGHRFLQ